MLILLTIIHVIVCLFLILVVLLQSGKAADIAGAFGGMGSQTTFGPRGAATALTKATTVAAALFMITSLSLAVLETRNAARGGVGGSGSALDKLKTSAPATAPKTGTPAPAQQQIPVSIPAQGGTVPAPATPAPAKK